MTISFQAIDPQGYKAMVSRGFSDLTELIPGKRYQLPEPCIESSLSVFLNQGTLDRDSDNGFTVISSTVFELKEALSGIGTRHVLHVRYQPE